MPDEATTHAVGPSSGAVKSRFRFSALVLLAPVLFLACVTTTESSVPVDVVEPAPLDPGERIRSLLAAGDAAYSAGEYGEAMAAYDVVLEAETPVPDRDRALFRLGVLRLLPGVSDTDPGAAREVLGRLLREHPLSLYEAPARVVLRLAARVQELEGDARRLEAETQRLARQLEALKRIDLGRDREQRPR